MWTSEPRDFWVFGDLKKQKHTSVFVSFFLQLFLKLWFLQVMVGLIKLEIMLMEERVLSAGQG